jgi:hypothetical protein
MKYELWDTESRNLLYHFDTEGEAIEAARELIALNAAIYPAKLALTSVEADGQMTTVAAGAELAMRLRAAATQRGRLPA